MKSKLTTAQRKRVVKKFRCIPDLPTPADIPKPITITIIYKGALSEITGCKSSLVVISEDMPFLIMLKIIFDEYPEIMNNYPPGTLGLLLNGHPPIDFETLNEGDEIIIQPVSKSKRLPN